METTTITLTLPQLAILIAIFRAGMHGMKEHTEDCQVLQLLRTWTMDDHQFEDTLELAKMLDQAKVAVQLDFGTYVMEPARQMLADKRAVDQLLDELGNRPKQDGN